jgi:hypothetical protein
MHSPLPQPQCTKFTRRTLRSNIPAFAFNPRFTRFTGITLLCRRQRINRIYDRIHHQLSNHILIRQWSLRTYRPNLPRITLLSALAWKTGFCRRQSGNCPLNRFRK